jgi:hypothetical protein
MSLALSRRDRWLLRAYPRRFRLEIGTTLLDMADAGHARLGVWPATHLTMCGFRQRFRLPGRRPLAWVGAVAAAVVLGAFGAAGGTWLAWRTAASIPSDHDLRALNAAMSGMPAPCAIYPETSETLVPDTTVEARGTSDYSGERIRVALTAAGWHITSFRESSGALLTFPDAKPGENLDFDSGVKIPLRMAHFSATKGGIKLDGGASAVASGTGWASNGMDVWPREPAMMRPMTIAGAVVGASVGWLFAAAAAYRIRESRRGRQWTATVVSTAGFAVVTVAVVQLYWNAYQMLTYPHGSPVPSVIDGPVDARSTIPCTLTALLALTAVVVIARPTSLRAPERSTPTGRQRLFRR